ncbi:MAG: tetraacyldisaccharide 4'-kinase [Prevotella sp.]|nr:tetraacyldisaccharide 4'-kinase [Prevotella sp.]
MRTEGDLIKINDWLIPLSCLYGMGVELRNQLFEMGFLKQKAYDIPVISVGNITVGGSGKTPHVEYLIRLLKDIVKIGVLSRGYKRKSRGYVLADIDTPMRAIGDEPCQMKRKFKDIYVAVDKNRCEGIDRLTSDEKTKDVDVILLDDAFQHRYVKPGINILLVDYHRLIIYDKLLPAGRLREPMKGKNRADIVIVTKCPKDLKPMEFRVLTKSLNLFPYQELFFTCIEYDKPRNVFPQENGLEEHDHKDTWKLLNGKNVLLLTGIASPEQMENDLKSHCRTITPLTFGDHHAFKAKDVEKINSLFASMPEPKVIVTTEKDSTRLIDLEGLDAEVQANMYELPIKVRFMLDQKEKFNTKIISYVRKNSRNSILVKRKDDDKPKDSHHTGNGIRTISFRDN